MAPAKPAAGHVFVARQPIFDRLRRVIGYELLFRPSAASTEAAAASADSATAHIISDALLSIGLDTLTDGKRAFVNVGRHLLLEGIPAILPPARVVLELTADVEADSEVIAACKALRQAGYSLAIDDFVPTAWTADLVPLADFLKVDCSPEADADVRKKVGARASAGARPALIAKKIETNEALELAKRDGYGFFQGYFFGQPIVTSGREVPGLQMNNLRLMRALNDPNLSVHKIEELIKHDTALCYRILRTVNSAAFALRTTVKSIREALVLLGRDSVRRWASVWVLAGLNQQAHSELVVLSTVRARCCELLAGSAGREEAAAEGFLLGMCSLLPAILERPMPEVLSGLPLEADTRAALLGEPNSRRDLLACAIAYERGEWETCAKFARTAGVDASILPGAYAEALRWSRELQKGAKVA